MPSLTDMISTGYLTFAAFWSSIGPLPGGHGTALAPLTRYSMYEGYFSGTISECHVQAWDLMSSIRLVGPDLLGFNPDNCKTSPGHCDRFATATCAWVDKNFHAQSRLVDTSVQRSSDEFLQKIVPAIVSTFGAEMAAKLVPELRKLGISNEKILAQLTVNHEEIKRGFFQYVNELIGNMLYYCPLAFVGFACLAFLILKNFNAKRPSTDLHAILASILCLLAACCATVYLQHWDFYIRWGVLALGQLAISYMCKLDPSAWTSLDVEAAMLTRKRLEKEVAARETHVDTTQEQTASETARPTTALVRSPPPTEFYPRLPLPVPSAPAESMLSGLYAKASGFASRMSNVVASPAPVRQMQPVAQTLPTLEQRENYTAYLAEMSSLHEDPVTEYNRAVASLDKVKAQRGERSAAAAVAPPLRGPAANTRAKNRAVNLSFA